MGGLTKRKFFSHCSGGWKSGIRVPAWSGSGESFLPGLQTATFLLCAHTEERETRSSLMYLSFFFNSSYDIWCEILVSQPGVKPIPPAVEAPILNHFPGQPGESCVSSCKGTNSFFRVPILMNSSKANYLPKDSPPIPLHSWFSTWILRGHNSPIVLAVQSLSLPDSGFHHPLSLRVCSNSCPLSQRCHLIIAKRAVSWTSLMFTWVLFLLLYCTLCCFKYILPSLMSLLIIWLCVIAASSSCWATYLASTASVNFPKVRCV